MKLITLKLQTLFAAALLLLASVSNGQTIAHHDMSSADYQNKVNAYNGQGYRVVHVCGYGVGTKAYYAAIWEKKSGPAYATHHGMTGSVYQQKVTSYHQQGYRLIQVNGFAVGNTAYYTAIWEKTTGPQLAAHHGMTGADYQAKFNNYSNQGYRLVWVSGYGVGNTPYYAAIWEKTTGPVMATHHGMSSADYQQKFNSYAGQGYTIKMVSGYNVGNTDYYAAIWEKTNSPVTSARHRLSSSNYQAEFENHKYQGYKPTLVSGYAMNGKATFAAIWENTVFKSSDLNFINNSVKSFMDQYNIPGASIAIAKEGKLVFAKGFGLGDTGTGALVSPKSLFRVASVSKPVTSAAIMKLIQDGKFSLTSKVFGTGSILGSDYGKVALGTWEKEITVQHLLEHTAGGWAWDNDTTGGVNDPMFAQSTFTHKQLIDWVLDNRNPSHKPGTIYAYSNFGYCVLGRIIEKVSGQKYDAYVKSAILSKCGISNMHIAGDTKDKKRADEVVYYGQGNDNPYAWKIARMDAHGGWIASSIDLLRYGVRVDDKVTKPDILANNIIDMMRTPGTVNNNYAKGWSHNPNTDSYFHNGSLPGTGSWFVLLDNGFAYAILVNGKSNSNSFFNDLHMAVRDIVDNNAIVWPSYDLF